MKIAILDEREPDRQLLRETLCAYGRMHPSLELETVCFSNAQRLRQYPQEAFDLLLLEAVPSSGGMELARALRAAGCQTPLIFVSASQEGALEAFELEALQYLRKPLKPQALYRALDAVLAAGPQDWGNRFAVSTQDGLVNLYYHNIAYVECVRHLAFFHLADQSVVCSRTLRQSFVSYIAPLLADERFLHPHHSYCVNRSFAYRLGPRSMELYGGHVIPVAKERVADIKKRYLEDRSRQSSDDGQGPAPVRIK